MTTKSSPCAVAWHIAQANRGMRSCDTCGVSLVAARSGSGQGRSKDIEKAKVIAGPPRRKSPNFAAQRKRAWDACREKMRNEPPLPMAKKGEESCDHEWGSCTQYDGQKHSCGIVEGHKVADQRHVCGSCFAQKKRNKDDDVEDDDDG